MFETKAQSKQRGAIRYEKWRSAGLCGSCGRAARPGMATCQSCYDRQLAWRKTVPGPYRKRRDKGLCGGCGKEPLPGQSACQKCKDARKACWDKASPERKKRKSRQTMESVKRNPVRHREQVQAYQKRLKAEVFEAYGGKCVCCGESGLCFLTIDHINGDGAAHRRSLSKHRKSRSLCSQTIYVWLKHNGFPKDFQILCYNCNCAKGTSEFCPHQLMKKETTK